jgi:hypothetical protein
VKRVYSEKERNIFEKLEVFLDEQINLYQAPSHREGTGLFVLPTRFII